MKVTTVRTACFRFESELLKKNPEFTGPIAQQSLAKLKQKHTVDYL